MAKGGAWVLSRLEEKASMRRLCQNTVAILFAVSLAPILLVSYVVVSVCRSLWCRLLERRFPDIEADRSPSVRAATDTRRNQGVVTVLLRVRGRCDANFIKHKFQEEILDRRNECGNLQFPRLRAVLTSRCGHYAWRPSGHDFRLDSHVVVGSQLFRGRAVSDANIQDYVSDIVSKSLPAEAPPWQIVVIPLAAPSTDPRFYVLLRMHHLLVSEVNALRELLAGDWGWDAPLIKRPQALPFLFYSLLGGIRNVWTNLRNDSVLSCKAPHQLLLVVWDTVSLLTWRVVLQPRSCYQSLQAASHAQRRPLSKLIRDSTSPWLWLCWWLRASVVVSRALLLAPYRTLQFVCRPQGSSALREALHEVFFWSRVALDAPRLVLGELLHGPVYFSPPSVSLCGRRVVAWSEPAPIALVEEIASAAGSSPAEVLLAVACTALREHYRRQGCNAPSVPVQPFGAPGVLLLPAPTPQDDTLSSLRAICHRIEATRRQPALLLASAWLRKHLARLLPSLMVRLLLNCVTRHYAAIVTTSAPAVLSTGKASLWGYTVDKVLLWRPPQANMSVSLSVMRLGRSVRLAVMADQQLWPHHAALPAAFLSYLRDAAATLGINSSGRYTLTDDASTSACTELLRQEEETLVD